MQSIKEKLADKIEVRLQFIITILTFFIVIIKELEQKGCILVAVYIIDYIFFTRVSNTINEKYLQWIDTTVLVGIGTFIIPLAVIALSTQGGTMPLFIGYSWLVMISASILLLVTIPIILLIMLIAYGVNWKGIFHK
jgi:hypothetical protein